MGTHYSHMTPADRMSIQALLQAKLSGPAIALKLGISRSTINRELNRSKARPTALATDYQAGVARFAASNAVATPGLAAASWVRTRSRRCGARSSMACAAVGRRSRSQANCPR